MGRDWGWAVPQIDLLVGDVFLSVAYAPTRARPHAHAHTTHAHTRTPTRATPTQRTPTRARQHAQRPRNALNAHGRAFRAATDQTAARLTL
jgi:hypothetical protein